MWRIAAPIMLSNLTLPIVGAVDTAMAGHLPGPEYLAGVSVATLIFGFAFWTFSFIRLSTTGYIAQAFGSGDMPELCNVAVRAAIVAVGIALLLLLVQFPIKFVSLFLIDAGDAVSHQAELYFDIRVWAAPAVMGNFVVTGILIGLQRAGLALVVQSIIAVVNVVLDLLFVLEFGWQVPGIAAATVAAEYSGLLIGRGNHRANLNDPVGADTERTAVHGIQASAVVQPGPDDSHVVPDLCFRRFHQSLGPHRRNDSRGERSPHDVSQLFGVCAGWICQCVRGNGW